MSKKLQPAAFTSRPRCPATSFGSGASPTVSSFGSIQRSTTIARIKDLLVSTRAFYSLGKLDHDPVREATLLVPDPPFCLVPAGRGQHARLGFAPDRPRR